MTVVVLFMLMVLLRLRGRRDGDCSAVARDADQTERAADPPNLLLDAEQPETMGFVRIAAPATDVESPSCDSQSAISWAPPVVSSVSPTGIMAASRTMMGGSMPR